MPLLSSAGIGSGLDVTAIIDSIMAVESRPLQVLDGKRALYTTQISAYGELIAGVSSFQSAVDKLNTAEAFNIYKTASSNTDIVDITSTSSPDIGSFAVEVSRLSEAHKMSSDSKLDSATFGGTAGDELTIQVGADVDDIVTVDLSTALTLTGIRDAINDDADNPGVSATIVTGDSNMQRLVITSDTTGEDSALSLSYGGTINSATLNLATVNDIGGDTSLLNSEFIVDGFTITRQNNTISDVIAGVTFELKAEDVGNEHTISVTRDDAALETLVKSFATAYNAVGTSVQSLRDGALGTNSMLSSIDNQISRILNTEATAGALSVLNDVGLSIDKKGVMSLDSEVFTAAIATSYDDVATLFTAEDDGFANRLSTLVDNWIGTGGLISSRSDGLNARIDELADRQLEIERNLVIIEARYRTQYSALDTLVSNFQSTSAFLTSQLAQIADIKLDN